MRILLSSLCSLCLCGSLLAELPSVRFDRLAPLGCAAGSSVEVDIAGNDIDDVKALRFDHPGLKAEFVKERHFKITVAADVPAGTYDVWLVGRFGVSNPRLFAVSRGLTEIAEKEPNDDAATAQAVPVNCVVNGTSDQNREDVFRFTAKQGQRIVIECQAGKLDSQLDATLTLMDASGKQLAANNDYFGRDSLVDFIAPGDGEYLVSVCDLSFRGGHPYRLVITDKPRVENVFPRAVQRGKPAELSVYGRNLGAGAKRGSSKIQDLALDEVRQPVTVPSDVFDLGAYRFFEHPTTHSVSPTAATCTLTGFQMQPAFGDFAMDAVPLLLVDTPVTLEVEPNDTPETAQKIALPAVVSGRFDRERDADWYEFEPDENGNYSFDVYCERIAGRADPYLVVIDDKGTRVNELDDFGIRTNAFDGHIRDASGMVNLQGKKKYRVLVQDRYRRGGARYQYVLTIHKPVPDFYVAAIHAQNPGPGGTTIRRGGAAYLDLIIHQKDGYNALITISAEGLPPGLHVQPTTIANTNHAAVVFWADANAADWAGPVKLIATGKRGDTALHREVRPYTRVWQEANLGSSRPMRELPIAVRETAPFSLQFASERVEVEAGKKAEVKLKLDRLWPDFKAQVNLLPLALPGPIRFNNAQIAPDKNEATLTFDVNNGAPPGDYTVAVIGQAQVPYNKDAKSAQKMNTLVSQPSQPVTLSVRAAAKK
jgi:hypothetical protein